MTNSTQPGRGTGGAGAECAGVSFSFGSRPVITALDARFGCGRMTAIIGPNGCGKSTLLRLILGSLVPSAGMVRLDGGPTAALQGRARAERLAYVAQRPEVWAAFTVREVVEFGRFAVSPAAGATDRALRRMDLGPLADRPMQSLSEGQRQRVSLARVLAQFNGEGQYARVVLADEPVSALDPRFAVHALGVLRELADPTTAVVVVLHDLNLAKRLADDALVLDAGGRVVAFGPVGDVLTPATMQNVFETPFDQRDDALVVRV